MNPFNRNILLLLVFVSFSMNHLKAQEVIRQAPCFDVSMKQQADSLIESMTLQGFKMVREAAMSMENQYEMPVILPLTAGSWYHVVFIGDSKANLYEVSMYDYAEKQVIYKKQGIENNIISYSFIPNSTEYHMIKPVQAGKRKIKKFCSFILVFLKEQQELLK